MSLDRVIDDIKRKSKLSSEMSKYIKLKPNGGSKWIGLCPFHNEKTPSFHINDESGLYYCFGCQEKGDIFNFTQKIKNLSFWDALVGLANEYQVDIPKSSSATNDNTLDELYYEINMQAMRFFQENLLKNSKVMSYLTEIRQLSIQTIQDFSFGYAGNDPSKTLLKYLVSLGYSEKLLLGVGLIRQYQTTYLDFFYDRLIIPIFNREKKVIAFSGRAFNDNKDSPKYINSPESAIFKKSRALYNINNVGRDSDKRLIIVEGYMDAVSLCQSGYRNVVAPMGTSFTNDQLTSVCKLSKDIIFWLDSDSAGRKAMYRVAEMVYATEKFDHINYKISFITNDKFKDVDEFLISLADNQKKNKIENSIRNSLPINRYIVDYLLLQRDIYNPKDEAFIRETFVKIISQTHNQNIIRSYISWLNNYIFELKKKKETRKMVPKIEYKNCYSSYHNMLLYKMLLLGVDDDRIVKLIDSQANDDIYFDFVEYYHNTNRQHLDDVSIVKEFLLHYNDQVLAQVLISALNCGKFSTFATLDISERLYFSKIAGLIIPDLVNLLENELSVIVSNGGEDSIKSITLIKQEIATLKTELYNLQSES